jgi:hypothetical protein
MSNSTGFSSNHLFEERREESPFGVLSAAFKDWLPAGKRAMCVSVREGGGEHMGEGSSKATGELSQEITALSELTLDELKERWRFIYNCPPPGRSSKKLLISAIAYRLQEQVSGGLKPSVRTMLERVAVTSAASRVPLERPAAKASTGTVLIRDWRGQSHRVTVLDRGVSYRRKNYRSLSEVARVITGTRWSGPRFFGLKTRSREGLGGTR